MKFSLRKPPFARLIVLLLISVLFTASCGGGATPSSPPTSPPSGSPSPSPTPTASPTTSPVAHDRVFIVVLENKSYSSVVGNAAMPFLNGLANSFGLATNYFANAHPSLPNYFVLTVGATEATSDDFPGPVSDDNVVRQLSAAGKSWRCYAQSLPSVGYTGGDQSVYIKHHNPFAYLTDVLSSSAQANNIDRK